MHHLKTDDPIGQRCDELFAQKQPILDTADQQLFILPQNIKQGSSCCKSVPVDRSKWTLC